MSECNFCKLERIKRCKPKGSRVVINSSNFLGGSDIYVVDKGEKPNEGNWKCWFMEIPNVCCCD